MVNFNTSNTSLNETVDGDFADDHADDHIDGRGGSDPNRGAARHDNLTPRSDASLDAVTADGGCKISDIDVLALQAGIDRGDWTGVRFYCSDGELIYDSTNPVAGQDDSTLPENGRVTLMDGNNVACHVSLSEIEKLVSGFDLGDRIAASGQEVTDLAVDDIFLTQDTDTGPIMRNDQRKLSPSDLHRATQSQTNHAATGSPGDSVPMHDRVLSPKHQLLIEAQRGALLFAELDRKLSVQKEHGWRRGTGSGGRKFWTVRKVGYKILGRWISTSSHVVEKSRSVQGARVIKHFSR